jgi:hypothetical protein
LTGLNIPSPTAVGEWIVFPSEAKNDQVGLRLCCGTQRR